MNTNRQKSTECCPSKPARWEASTRPRVAVIILLKAMFFWKCSQNQLMKQRSEGAFEGGIQRELTSLCTYYAPVSTLSGCHLHFTAGERKSQIRNFPHVIQLQMVALGFNQHCSTPKLMLFRLRIRRIALSLLCYRRKRKFTLFHIGFHPALKN